MFRPIASVFSFLTIFRFRLERSSTIEEVAHNAWLFPLVGVILGLILSSVFYFVSFFFPVVMSSVICVSLWFFLTGALHLDGWTDCWDAIGASAPQDRRRQILKDSRLGTFGALSLVLLVCLKIVGVEFSQQPIASILIAAAAGRSSMLVGACGSLKTGDGIASIFLGNLRAKTVWAAGIIGMLIGGVFGWTGLLAVVTAYLISRVFRRFAEGRLGMVNGDVIGAMCELSEAVVLIVFCLRM
jgi:adenosylcobinamide-GDP ribazoletransferase